ncbi:hypothetical protein C818_00941 [Lachnospiraceae bacterium MD308]|jgi:DNA-binding GntR family transcriptional regulator|nr:hypothetical protein C818_00941 [Lachnospiraceae bacterium MD308]MCI8502354.1 GntR family transcriptional regulator [Dorea sp.]
MTHKTGLSTIAYQQIKTLILENKLKPGQFVNEAQLQELLGLGRTPVREAILQLAENELITIHPRKGIEISRIMPKSIHDIFQVRILIEPEILHTYFKELDKKHLMEFRASFQKASSSDTLSLQDCIRLADTDNQFHLAIVSSMGNQYTTRLMNTFVDKLTIIRSTVSAHSVGRLCISSNEHIEIIDSILTGEIDTACMKLKKHLEISYEEAVKTLMYTY